MISNRKFWFPEDIWEKVLIPMLVPKSPSKHRSFWIKVMEELESVSEMHNIHDITQFYGNWWIHVEREPVGGMFRPKLWGDIYHAVRFCLICGNYNHYKKIMSRNSRCRCRVRVQSYEMWEFELRES